jgi:hypothetical protein
VRGRSEGSEKEVSFEYLFRQNYTSVFKFVTSFIAAIKKLNHTVFRSEDYAGEFFIERPCSCSWSVTQEKE